MPLRTGVDASADRDSPLVEHPASLVHRHSRHRLLVHVHSAITII